MARKIQKIIDDSEGEKRESADELRKMVVDKIKAAGFSEDVEGPFIQGVENTQDDPSFFVSVNYTESEETEECAEKIEEVCEEIVEEVCEQVCWVIQVIIWVFQAFSFFGGGGGSCLPADAPMLTWSGLMPVAEVGLKIPVLTSGGFMNNYMDPHMDFHATTLMQYLKAASGHELYLSDQHYIKADGRYMFAMDVSIGMAVEVIQGNGTRYSSQIVEKQAVFKRGLFSPFNAAGDYAIGTHGLHGGIVVSVFSEFLFEGILPTEIIPSIYAKLFAPLSWIGDFCPGWLERFNQDMWQKSVAIAQPGKPVPAFDKLGLIEIVKSAYVTMWTGLAVCTAQTSDK